MALGTTGRRFSIECRFGVGLSLLIDVCPGRIFAFSVAAFTLTRFTFGVRLALACLLALLLRVLFAFSLSFLFLGFFGLFSFALLKYLRSEYRSQLV